MLGFVQQYCRCSGGREEAGEGSQWLQRGWEAADDQRDALLSARMAANGEATPRSKEPRPSNRGGRAAGVTAGKTPFGPPVDVNAYASQATVREETLGQEGVSEFSATSSLHWEEVLDLRRSCGAC